MSHEDTPTISPEDSHEDTIAFILLWLYVALFAICTVIAFVPLVREALSQPWRSDLMQAARIIVPVGLLWRTVYFIVVLIYYYKTNTNYLLKNFKDQAVVFLFGRLPVYWNFSEYLLVLLIWEFHLSRSSGDTIAGKWMQHLKIAYAVVNVFIYTVVLIPVLCPKTELFTFEGYFASAMCILMSLLFCVVGTRMYKKMKLDQNEEHKNFSTRDIIQGAVVTLLWCIDFLFRASYILADQIHHFTAIQRY